jgi:ABC-type multidrug transport system fused ATPase/permease subunit
VTRLGVVGAGTMGSGIAQLGCAAGMEVLASVAIAFVLAYAGARFAGVLFDNFRNAVFERVGQDAARRLAEHAFRHIHALSLRFHLERRTGSLTKIVERGTRSIDMMLYFLLFNVGPTLIELVAVCVIFWVKFGPGLVAATLALVVVYILFTRWVTEWRARLRREMNEIDNRAIGRAVDSLLNYETVKYFGAEEREARRYGAAMRAYRDSAVKNETSLAFLNVGQAVITNAATDADNVVGLVYVAAFAPDEGETLGAIEGDSRDSVLGTSLLELRYPTDDGTGTGDTAMPGMATSEELARLRALSGEELDVYFLQLMLRHHQGGLPMAEYAVEHATVPVVATLAQTMVDGQEYEIGLMESMLAERGAEPLPPPF